MEYKISGNDIILHETEFDLDQTLDCGQAFRWTKIADSCYSGYFIDKPLKISSEGEYVTLHDTCEKDFLEVWVPYFDLERSYCELKLKYSADPTLKAACEYSGGIRLLRQDPWECLVSYIFSSNNNITRIKGIIARLVERYGRFPTPEMLACETPDTLADLRSGFRAKYVIDGAQKVLSGEVDLGKCVRLPYDEAKAELMKIKGVGPKVADCVLLYSLDKLDAWPIDVWIKRVMETYYPDGLPECMSGTRGIAQLYLFNYIRNLEK